MSSEKRGPVIKMDILFELPPGFEDVEEPAEVLAALREYLNTQAQDPIKMPREESLGDQMARGLQGGRRLLVEYTRRSLGSFPLAD